MEIKIIDQKTIAPNSWASFQDQITQFDWGGAKFIANKMLGRMGPKERIAVVLDNDQVIGFGGLVQKDIAELPYTPFISTIYVSSKYRKQNIGTLIVTELQNKAVQLGFNEVFIISNLNNYYEKMNFIHIETIHDFMGRSMKLYQKTLS